MSRQRSSPPLSAAPVVYSITDRLNDEARAEAEAARAAGQADAAVRAYRRVRSPGIHDCVAAADAALAAGDPDAAVYFAKQAVEQAPVDAPLVCWAANIALHRVGSAPDWRVYVAQAGEWLRALVAGAPSEPAPPEVYKWLSLTCALKQPSDQDGAARALRDGLAVHPDNRDLRRALAQRLVDREPGAALDLLAPALDDVPSTQAWFTAAEAYAALGAHANARRLIGEITPREGTDVDDYAVLRGDVAMACGDAADAAAWFGRAARAAWVSAAVNGALGLAALALARRDVADAHRRVAEALERLLSDQASWHAWVEVRDAEQAGGHWRLTWVAPLVADLLATLPDADAALGTPEAPRRAALRYFEFLLADDLADDETPHADRLAHAAEIERLGADPRMHERFAWLVDSDADPGGYLRHLAIAHAAAVRRALAAGTVPEDFESYALTGEPDYAAVDRAGVRGLHAWALALAAHCASAPDPEGRVLVEALLVPLYTQGWATLLAETGHTAEALDAARRVAALAPSCQDAWFDVGYHLHDTPGRHAEAIAAYERALALGPHDAAAANLALLREHAAPTPDAPPAAAVLAPAPPPVVPAAAARAAQHRAALLATAPDRFAGLDGFKKRLLAVLLVAPNYGDVDALAELSNIEVRYLPGHLRKLEQAGCIHVPEPGTAVVAEELRPFVERERQHAVATRYVRADPTVAFKPIFNSALEYAIYGIVTTLFPNHLVFPNMGLQAIFQYERMQGLLDAGTFSYFLKASVDLCIVNTGSYLPVVAVEIDSTWHDTARQQARDTRKDTIFQRGGVGLIRVRAHGTPSQGALRAELVGAFREYGELHATDQNFHALMAQLQSRA